MRSTFKVFAALLLLCAPLSAHQRGWYFSLGMGAGLMQAERSVKTEQTRAGSGHTATPTTTEMIYADADLFTARSSYLQAAYGHKFITGRWFFGFEAFLGWGDHTIPIEGKETWGGSSHRDPADGRMIQSNLKRDANAGFVTFLGYCLGFTAPYLKMGFEIGRFEHQWTEIGQISFTKTSYSKREIVPGFLVGGGFELGAGLATIRLDYSATLSNIFEYDFEPVTDYKIYNKSRPLTHVAKLDIVYHFPY